MFETYGFKIQNINLTFLLFECRMDYTRVHIVIIRIRKHKNINFPIVLLSRTKGLYSDLNHKNSKTSQYSVLLSGNKKNPDKLMDKYRRRTMHTQDVFELLGL